MEQNPFGLHIMDNAVHWGNADRYLDEAQPAMTLVFNHYTAALSIKKKYPSMHVVHRNYNGNDFRWHEVITPHGWWWAFAGQFRETGLIITCYNEPRTFSRRLNCTRR